MARPERCRDVLHPRGPRALAPDGLFHWIYWCTPARPPLSRADAGKTWTIAFAVRVLLARGASVLITSYTHSAVDNLLLKLIQEGVRCLRIGKPDSVHPGVRAHCINEDGSVQTTAAYAELVESVR